MTDKELADHLDAQDRLMARGLVKKQCEQCKGNGIAETRLLAETGLSFVTECSTCGGKGYFWVKKEKEKA